MGRLRASANRGVSSISLIHPEAIYDIDFANGQWFGALPSDLVVSRASEALTLTAGGTYANFASNTARITGNGLLIEEARTNLFLNSTAPATQTITVVNGTTYTVSCFIAGSAALSGAGSGTATPGSPVTFVASSASLTVTISGSPSYVNVSAASFSLSPIATAGTAATRPADVVYLPISGVGTEYTVYCEAEAPPSGAPGVVETWASANDRTSIRFSSLQAAGAITSGGASQTAPNPVNVATNRRAAMRVQSNAFQLVSGGVLGGGVSGIAPAVTPSRLYIGSVGGGTVGYFNGCIRRFAIIPRALSDAELQTLAPA